MSHSISFEQSTQKHDRAIHAVIFDLDGVLVDSEWLAFLVWQEVLASYGGRLDEGAFPHMVGLTAEETALYTMRYTGVTFDVAEGCARAWQDVSRRLSNSGEPLPGAAALVRLLVERGIPIAIASNSPSDYIKTALTGIGLLAHFPVRVGIDLVAEGKPAPDVYLAAAQRLGLPPEHCLAIEDSRVGVRAACAAGMRVIAVPAAYDNHQGFERAWHICKSLIEARAIIEPLLVPHL